MDITGWITYKAFLQKCSPAVKNSLLKYAAQKEVELLENLPSPFGDPCLGKESFSMQIQQIHPSWLALFFRTLSKNDMNLFLSSLEPPQTEELKNILLFSNELVSPAPFAKLFLHQFLWKKITEEEKELLSIPCLPSSPLNALLKLDYDAFIRFFHFLGLRDLSFEMKRIIETSRLKKIYSALSKKEQQYLKTLSVQKDSISFKQPFLANWDGTTETLRSALLQRGINRLAKALFGQHSSLIWHISRRLEIEVAGSLFKFMKGLEHPRASSVLIEQITETLSYLYQQPS